MLVADCVLYLAKEICKGRKESEIKGVARLPQIGGVLDNRHPRGPEMTNAWAAIGATPAVNRSHFKKLDTLFLPVNILGF
jgi:hypothetical protein